MKNRESFDLPHVDASVVDEAGRSVGVLVSVSQFTPKNWRIFYGRTLNGARYGRSFNVGGFTTRDEAIAAGHEAAKRLVSAAQKQFGPSKC